MYGAARFDVTRNLKKFLVIVERPKVTRQHRHTGGWVLVGGREISRCLFF